MLLGRIKSLSLSNPCVFQNGPNKDFFSYQGFSLSFLSHTVNDIRRKLYMVGTYSTEEKRAKRMPDATVETTSGTFVYWTALNPSNNGLL